MSVIRHLHLWAPALLFVLVALFVWWDHRRYQKYLERRVLENQYPYKCQDCDEAFNHTGKMVIHILKEHPERFPNHPDYKGP